MNAERSRAFHSDSPIHDTMLRSTRHPRSLPLGAHALALALATPLLVGCGDEAATDGASTPDASAPTSAAHRHDARATPAWFERPRDTWPALVARHDADLGTFGSLDGGLGFLGRDGDGELLAITARHWLTPAAGLAGEVAVPYLERSVRRWELVGPRGRARVGARARSGCDVVGSDLVLLDAALGPDGVAPCEPLVLSERVPELAEALIVAGADGALFDAELAAYAAGAALVLDLVGAHEPSAVMGAPVLDANGHAVACVGAIETRTGDGGAASTRVHAQLLRPFLRAPAPLRGEPVAFENPGFEELALDPSGQLLFMGSALLGGARIVEWPSGRAHAGATLPAGQGVGAFTADGWLVTAGRGGRFGVFDTLTRTTLVEGRAPILLVTALALLDDRRAVFGSGFEDRIALCDLTTGDVLEELDLGGAAFALSDDGAWLAVGGGTGDVHLVDLSAAAEGSAFGERRALTSHDDQVSCLAFAPDGELVASGGWDGVVRVSNVADGALLWQADGRSEINDLLFDAASNLVVATGSIEDLGDGRGPLDCYVRVFRGVDGHELARSHDHDAPVVALGRDLARARREIGPALDAIDPNAPQVLGVALGSEHFRWQLPR